MTTQEKVHEQSRWEIVAAFLTGFFIVLVAAALFVWALSTPTTDPRNEPADDASPVVMMEA